MIGSSHIKYEFESPANEKKFSYRLAITTLYEFWSNRQCSIYLSRSNSRFTISVSFPSIEVLNFKQVNILNPIFLYE